MGSSGLFLCVVAMFLHSNKVWRYSSVTSASTLVAVTSGWDTLSFTCNAEGIYIKLQYCFACIDFSHLILCFVFFFSFPLSGGSMARKGRERTANVRWRAWLVSNWLPVLVTHLHWGSPHWLVPVINTGRRFCFGLLFIHASLSNNTAEWCTLQTQAFALCELRKDPPPYPSTMGRRMLLFHCFYFLLNMSQSGRF